MLVFAYDLSVVVSYYELYQTVMRAQRSVMSQWLFCVFVCLSQECGFTVRTGINSCLVVRLRMCHLILNYSSVADYVTRVEYKFEIMFVS